MIFADISGFWIFILAITVAFNVFAGLQMASMLLLEVKTICFPSGRSQSLR